MKFKEHPVETFDDNIRRHAAHNIVEVVDDSNPNNIDKFCGYTKNGFYFICEDEATVTGPFASFDGAVEARDVYFEMLLERD